MVRNLLSSALICLLCACSASAIATPTAISTATVAGNTVTVNSTSHGLAVNQGFCVVGSSQATQNVCGVVATVPNANSITYNLSGVVACAATCGTIAPARQIVILSSPPVSQAEVTVNYVLWLTSNAGISTTAVSQVAGISGAESAALSAGRFIEKARSRELPTGLTLAQIKTELQADFSAMQSAQTNGVQPGAFTGNYFDGVSWLQ